MSEMTESATARRISEQCAGAVDTTLPAAIALLKRANRYVGVHPTIGGQKLGEEITEFIASYARQEPKP